MAYEEEAKALAKGPKKRPAPDGDDAGETDAEEMSSYDDAEDSAADELATLAGVEDKAAFKSALRDYVRACVERSMSKAE